MLQFLLNVNMMKQENPEKVNIEDVEYKQESRSTEVEFQCGKLHQVS